MDKHQAEVDLLWWKGMISGDREALYNLYSAYYAPLMDFGKKLTNDMELIKDGINSVFLYFWEKRDNLQQDPHVKHYIFLSFKRTVVKAIHRSNLNEDWDQYDDNMESIESAETIFISRQESILKEKQMKKAILALSKRERQLIFLRYYEDLSYDEIAARTGLSLRTIYNRINTAIKALRANKNLPNPMDFVIFLFCF